MTGIPMINDLNENGVAVFSASVDPGDGSSVPTHFVGTPGNVSEIYREGGTTPIGGVWTNVQNSRRPSIHADGSVTFCAEVEGGSATGGMFRWDAGTVTALILNGAAVPDGSGDQFENFYSPLDSNEAGDIPFGVRVVRSGAGSSSRAVYVLSGGQAEAIIHEFDVIPGTSPELHFRWLGGSGPPAISADGVVAINATLNDAQDQSYNAILISKGGVIEIMALVGDPVPGRPGYIFHEFFSVRINSSGQIAIQATAHQGEGTHQREGIFIATPVVPVIPSLRGIGLLAAAITIALVGTFFLHRHEPSNG
jgi:hypothetical protein